MAKLKNAICLEKGLFQSTDPSKGEQFEKGLPGPKTLRLGNLIKKPFKKVKDPEIIIPGPAMRFHNLTQELSASLESIDKINMKLKNYKEEPEVRPIQKKKGLIGMINGKLTKRSPRNSILPYSVFEDYLLFKCYLDKPDDNPKTTVRTRQSGHLGKRYSLYKDEQ